MPGSSPVAAESSEVSGRRTEATPGARQRRGPRRASRPAAAGTDPHPSQHVLTSKAGEDRPEGWGDVSAPLRGAGENDARLRLDRPPHWG